MLAFETTRILGNGGDVDDDDDDDDDDDNKFTSYILNKVSTYRYIMLRI